MTESSKHESSGAAAPPIERRQYPRYPAHVPIELQEDGNLTPLRMETTDLSCGGCYVELVNALTIGTYLNTTLWLDGAAINMRGLVVTRHPDYGNGIMFLDFQGDGKEMLGRYLDAIAP
ncbi:MAG: PilZ domain-containing protein [Terriglobales bacterium]